MPISKRNSGQGKHDTEHWAWAQEWSFFSVERRNDVLALLLAIFLIAARARQGSQQDLLLDEHLIARVRLVLGVYRVFCDA